MEAVGQLTGGIAHDFNNLLMVVMGNLQLVEQLVRNDERALKRIRAAIDASEKGSELTRRMLAFSRQQTLQNKEVTLNDLLFSMQDMLQQALTAIVEPQDHSRRRTCGPSRSTRPCWKRRSSTSPSTPATPCSPRAAALIIETSNRKLDNTSTAPTTRKSSPATTWKSPSPTRASGMTPDIMEKVFQPFFTTKGPEKGSGLGLSMIYGFVKQSNGHIKMYSEVGHGTTVKIYLPRLKGGSAKDITPEPAHRPAGAVADANSAVLWGQKAS
jgi:light-regulated signal transduction histidine kinase (bacteriophytochrome)